MTCKFALTSDNARETQKSSERSQKISERSKFLVTLIWGYTNHFQDTNSKSNGYSAFTFVIQKGLDLYEPWAVQGAYLH